MTFAHKVRLQHKASITVDLLQDGNYHLHLLYASEHIYKSSVLDVLFLEGRNLGVLDKFEELHKVDDVLCHVTEVVVLIYVA